MRNAQQTIRILRALGWSQTKIAKEIGVEQATVSRWEAGNASNAAEAALKLARLLDSASKKPSRRRNHDEPAAQAN